MYVLHTDNNAHMQQVFHDGSLSLHTRSLKYGKVKILLSIVPVTSILHPSVQLTEGCLYVFLQLSSNAAKIIFTISYAVPCCIDF